jgi:hypothetical protein
MFKRKDEQLNYIVATESDDNGYLKNENKFL